MWGSLLVNKEFRHVDFKTLNVLCIYLRIMSVLKARDMTTGDEGKPEIIPDVLEKAQ